MNSRGTDEEEASYVKFSEPINYFQNGEVRKALKSINRHIKNGPHDDIAYGIKLQILEHMHRWDEAIKCIDHMTEAPASEAMILKANFYARAGRVEEALEHMDIAERAGAPPAMVYHNRADIMTIMSTNGHVDMFDEAIKCAEKACSLDEKNSEYHATLAGILLVSNHNSVNADRATLKKALVHGKKALKLGNRSHVTYYNIGRIFFTVQKINTALKYFKRSLKINSDYSRARGMVGMSMSFQKDKSLKHYEMAIRYMEDALTEDQSLSFLFKGMGNAYIHLGDRVKAIKYMEMATNVEPHDVHAWTILMVAYVASNNRSEAERCHKRAVSLDPNVRPISELFDIYSDMHNSGHA